MSTFVPFSFALVALNIISLCIDKISKIYIVQVTIPQQLSSPKGKMNYLPYTFVRKICLRGHGSGKIKIDDIQSKTQSFLLMIFILGFLLLALPRCSLSFLISLTRV